MEKLIANLLGKPRYETLNGRRYLVRPLSMLVPGVLNGSRGPLLYPIEEIQRDHDAWNNMPIVVNHPMDEKGNGISARSPHIIEKFGIGHVFKVTANDKLAAEGWFDEEKALRIIPNEYEKLKRGEPVELSTGLFTDNHPVKNGKTEDGKRYDAVARNYRPDHLAILPSSKGACSIADGCGVNVNEANDEELNRYIDWDEDPTHNSSERATHAEIVNREEGVKLPWYRMLSSLTSNCGAECECDKCKTENSLPSDRADVSPEKACKILKDGTVHGHPLTEAQRGMFGAICGKRGKGKSDNKSSARNELTNNERKGADMAALTKEQREDIIDNLISNEGVEGEGPWEEDDRIGLNELPDGKLAALDRQRQLAANMCDEEETEGGGEEDEEEMPPPAPKKKPPFIKNERKSVERTKLQQPDQAEIERQAVQNWLRGMGINADPKDVGSAINNALSFEKSQKDALIARITKNERNMFAKKYLEDKSLDELRGLAALAANSNDDHVAQQQRGVLIADYAGATPHGFTQNLGEDFSREDLDMAPEPFDWSQATKE